LNEKLNKRKIFLSNKKKKKKKKKEKREKKYIYSNKDLVK